MGDNGISRVARFPELVVLDALEVKGPASVGVCKPQALGEDLGEAHQEQEEPAREKGQEQVTEDSSRGWIELTNQDIWVNHKLRRAVSMVMLASAISSLDAVASDEARELYAQLYPEIV